MAGLEAFHNSGGDCYPRREDGVLRVAKPAMLVSLFWMTERGTTQTGLRFCPGW